MLSGALILVSKISLIGLLLLGCYLGLDKHSARLRYQWLTLAAALLLVFPLLDQLLSSFSIELAVRPSHFFLQESADLLQKKWLQYSLLVYCFISVWLMLYCVLGLVQLRRLRKQSEAGDKRMNRILSELSQKIGLKKPVTLSLHSSRNLSPCTFGYFKPVILLPEGAQSWPQAQIELVLLHELAHVKHGDFLRINSVRLLVAVYWFFPPLWFLLNEMKKLSEQLADDTVLNAGVNDTDYAEVLLEAGRLHKRASAMAIAVNGNGEYYQRVMTVMDRYADRDGQNNRTARPMFWFLVLCALSAAAVDLKAKSKGYLQLPIDVVDVKTVLDSNNGMDKSSWGEALTVVASAHQEKGLRWSMSGYLAGSIEMPSSDFLQDDVDVQAVFNIDADGKAYGVKLEPTNLLPELRYEIKNSIQNSQFAAHRLNGEPVLLTGVKQRYRFSKVMIEEKRENEMSVKSKAVNVVSASLVCASLACAQEKTESPSVAHNLIQNEKQGKWSLASYGKPRFPRRAIVNGMQGWVDLSFDVDVNGEPSNIKVIKTSGGRNFVRDSKISIKKFRLQAPADVTSDLEGVVYRMCFIFTKKGDDDINRKKKEWGCGFRSDESNINFSKGKGIAHVYKTNRAHLMERRRERRQANDSTESL